MSMKKILAALLLMMMVLTAAGAMASANLRVRNTDMRVGQYAYVSWGNEIALSQTKPESGGYVYYRSDNVMEMHDFQFPSYGSFQYTIGVTSGSGLFTMEIYGDNLVNNAYSGQAASTATAIFCALPLEIKLMNGATLRAEATAISEGNQAIWASETLAVTGSGTLNAVGGNTNVSYQNSYGIRVGNSSGASTAMTVGSGVALNAQSGSAHLESAGIYVQGKLSSAGHITAQSGAGVSEDYAIDASAVEITAGSMTAKAADTASPAMNKAPSVYTGADVLVSKTSNAAHDPSLTYAASEIGQYTFVQVDKAKPEHAHHACGEDSCADTAHGHAATPIEYAALDPDYDDGEAWLTGTAYYLKEDIEIKNNNRIVFANTGTVYLCLNGHTITSHEALNSLTANGNLVLCDCQGDGLITRKASMTGRGVSVNGDMTMYGGKISGHSDTSIWGGGAYVGRNMTMYGGEISGNSAQNGAGGVYAVNGLTMHGGKISRNTTQGNGGGVLTGSSGVINLYGGEISGNTAAKGGGLYAASGNTVNVSGAPFVMNNLAKGAENNIELSSNVNLKLTGALTGDEQTIGVTKAGVLPIQFMEAAGTAVNHTYVKKIYSDEAYPKDVQNGYGVFYGNHTISVTANPYAGGTVSGTGRYKSGEKCYLYATPGDGYTFVNWTDADGSVFSTEANHNFIVTWNETLTANFDAITYTLSYDLDGGSLPEGKSNPDSYTVESETITLVNPQKEGYTFAGWTGVGVVEAAQSVVIPHGSMGSRRYTATWTKNAAPAHTHYVCGEDACTVHSGMEHLSVTYTPYVAGMTLEGGMAVYLTENMTVSEMIEISSMDAVYICLNGFTLTADGDFDVIGGYAGNIVLCDCKGTGKITHAAGKKGSGIRFSHNGLVTMYGGEISGNTSVRDGGGVDTGSQGHMTMHGGKICGNTGRFGGGVYSSNSFYMYGGEISGNTATSAGGGVAADFMARLYGGTITGNTTGGNGGGVYIDSRGYPVVKGGVTITGNHKGSGEDAQANNLFLLDGIMMTVDGALTGRIGVTTQNAPTIMTPVVYLEPSSEYTLTDSDLAATFSDEEYDQRINSEGNGELYIKAVTYTLSYDLNGGSLPDGEVNPDSYTVESGAITLVNPQKEGYTFAGWTGTGLTEATQTVTIPTGSTGNRSYKATWTVNQYTINFDTDGGSAIEPITADYGAAVTAPADPQRSGYTFAGWNPAIPQTMPAENLTIKATWTREAYTIGYDLAGGELPQGKSNPAGYSVDSETITLVNPEKTGHTFVGWTGTGLDGASQTVVIPKGSSGNRSYTATWTADHAHRACGAVSCSHSGHTADVVYLPWDGSSKLQMEEGKVYHYYLTKGFSTTDQIHVPAGATLNLCLNDNLVGANAAGAGVLVEGTLNLTTCSSNTAILSNKDRRTNPDDRLLMIKAGGEVNLYRFIWLDSMYLKTLIENRGTLNVHSTQNVIFNAYEDGLYALDNYGTVVFGGDRIYTNKSTNPLSAAVYNRSGASFTMNSGKIDESKTGIMNEGDLVLNNCQIYMNQTGIDFVSGSVTIGENVVTIRNNKDDDANLNNLVMRGNQKLILPGKLSQYSKIGIRHEKQKDLVTPIDFAQIGDGEKVTQDLLETVFTSDVADYSVRRTADAKTGQLVMASGKVTIVNGTGSAEGLGSLESVVKGATVSVKANEAPAGYVFTGWTSEDGVTFADAAAAETTFVMPGKDVTVTANFAKDDYTITYDLAGGELPEGKENPVSYSVDTPSFILEEPQKYGYEFAGWTGSNGDTPQKNIGVAAGSTGNLNFTANYTPVVYSITIDLNGGTLPAGETNPTTYTIETESFTLKNPEMEGHTFAGWTGSNGEIAQPNITIAKGSTGDLSYTANYSLNHYQVSASCDPAMGTVTGSGEYGHGTQATLTAEPNAGYVFMRWVNAQGETVSEDAVYSFTVYGPCSLTAVFEAQAVNLPQTGDSSNIALWAGLMMMCSACALMLARKRRA